ncbi:MAG: hypothetical protein Q4Q25_02640, partial [Methanocorpusculum sp.]|nr:hypothetical protein [Methanocorpusculum sp.]
NIYIRQEAEYDAHYFHPFELSERLNKLGGYVNMGELVWDHGAFCGNDFSFTLQTVYFCTAGYEFCKAAIESSRDFKP